jgi:hypothetical protein
MPEISYQVVYSPDYPSEAGLSHAYFTHVGIDGQTMIQYRLISLHPASGCLIDHNARIGDVEIPQEIVVEAERLVWRINQG